MFKGSIKEQKIRPELCHGHGGAINQELNVYLGGMSVHECHLATFKHLLQLSCVQLILAHAN